MKIHLPKLHLAQREIVRSPARFKVVAAGRRFGKTRLGSILCLTTILQRSGRIWWIAPSYKMAEVGWRTMKSLAVQIQGTRIHETEREIEFPGGGIVAARSADDPQSLRGESLDGVVLDECA